MRLYITHIYKYQFCICWDSMKFPFKLLCLRGAFVFDDYGRWAKANTTNKKKTAPNKIYKVNDFVGELFPRFYYILWIR